MFLQPWNCVKTIYLLRNFYISSINLIKNACISILSLIKLTFPVTITMVSTVSNHILLLLSISRCSKLLPSSDQPLCIISA
jgi:uncharacterized BrkB/YihY/UPF0761 family membrane protein